jgi:CheY-like chemotaxis protein
MPGILIVDDEHAELTYTTRCLESAGYAVAGALSAEAALSLPPYVEFDIALIDVAMWPLNGTEVAKKLTREGRSIRFLFMSGSAGLGMLDARALDGLIWAFLPKPFTAAQLTAALKNLKGCGEHEHANDETTT